ncbi:MAG: hypothetical protein A4E65_02369 [Syntrophorhabdus sp. PtaU1.Bin153]|nr:MAG: hypothetical protein A4E65_02369 [Syntrophorhabdus sp. PtaU1.Bin153]
MEAIITGRGLGIALGYFDARQKGYKLTGAGRGKTRTHSLSRTKTRKGDVTVRVRRAGGHKTVSGKHGNKVFLAQMKSGHMGVFVRTRKGRTPIEQLFGPGIGGLFGSRKIMQAVRQLINSKFSPEFNHQLAHYLGRIK